MAAVCPGCGCRNMDKLFSHWYCFSCGATWKDPLDPEERRMWWMGFIWSFGMVLVMLDISIILVR